MGSLRVIVLYQSPILKCKEVVRDPGSKHGQLE